MFLYMIFLLYLNENGSLDIVRSTDKCNLLTVHHTLNFMLNPKHWNGTLPIDGYYIKYPVSVNTWANYCHRIEMICYDPPNVLILPKPECL